MSLFNDLPKDVRILVCLLLPRKYLSLVSQKFLKDEYDIFWKERMKSLGCLDNHFYSPKCRCETFECFNLIKNSFWSEDMLSDLLKDEIFLTKYLNEIDRNGQAALAWAVNNNNEFYIKQLIAAGANVDINLL
jgi:ankyrin repeat protein